MLVKPANPTENPCNCRVLHSYHTPLQAAVFDREKPRHLLIKLSMTLVGIRRVTFRPRDNIVRVQLARNTELDH